jgi:hypothetical protein
MEKMLTELIILTVVIQSSTLLAYFRTLNSVKSGKVALSFLFLTCSFSFTDANMFHGPLLVVCWAKYCSRT